MPLHMPIVHFLQCHSVRGMYQIWQLDDTEYWHAVTAATLQHLEDWQQRSFYTSRDLFYAFDECGDHPKQLPQVLLMDFYLQGERGDQVTAALRRRGGPAALVTVIGFSSVRSCSRRIVDAGGNLALIKAETGDGINHHLLDYLQHYQPLQA